MVCGLELFFFLPILGFLSGRVHFIFPGFHILALLSVSFISSSLTPDVLLIV